jgi:uncharacterized membrane protein
MNAHAFSAAATAFLASLVEFIEALTVVLAVGATRGWRNALAGAAAAIAVLAAALAVLGPSATLTATPLRLAAGMLSLLFGLRWLRKAVLRAAGVLPLHDETKSYAKARASLGPSMSHGWDAPALGVAFQIVLTEGVGWCSSSSPLQPARGCCCRPPAAPLRPWPWCCCWAWRCTGRSPRCLKTR